MLLLGLLLLLFLVVAAVVVMEFLLLALLLLLFAQIQARLLRAWRCSDLMHARGLCFAVDVDGQCHYSATINP